MNQIRILLPEHKCNLNCKYCFSSYCYGNEIERDTVIFDFKKLKEQLDLICFQRISIWGGEPFLQFENLEKIVEWLKLEYPHKEIFILTNGYLLPKYIEWINRNKITISISHDGLRQDIRGKDFLLDPQYITAIKSIEKFAGFNCVYHGKQADMKDTLDYFRNVEQILDRQTSLSLGWFKCDNEQLAQYMLQGSRFYWFSEQIKYLIQEYRNGNHLAECVEPMKARFINEKNRTSCGADNRLTVRVDGKRFYCQVLGESAVSDEDNRKILKKSVLIPQECECCKYARWCKGICPSLTRDYRQKLCMTYRILYKEIVDEFYGGDV